MGLYNTPLGWFTTFKNVFKGQKSDDVKLQLEIFNAIDTMNQNTNLVKPLLKAKSLVVTTVGPNDVIDFSNGNFLGTKPVAIVGKLANGTFEKISNAPGYTVNNPGTTDTDNDTVLLENTQNSLLGDTSPYTLSFSMSNSNPGVTIQWTANRYTAVYMYYINITGNI